MGTVTSLKSAPARAGIDPADPMYAPLKTALGFYLIGKANQPGDDGLDTFLAHLQQHGYQIVPITDPEPPAPARAPRPRRAAPTPATSPFQA